MNNNFIIKDLKQSGLKPNDRQTVIKYFNRIKEYEDELNAMDFDLHVAHLVHLLEANRKNPEIFEYIIELIKTLGKEYGKIMTEILG